MIKTLILIFSILYHPFTLAGENEKTEVFKFFWDKNNSLLEVDFHTYIRNLATKLDKNNYDFFIIKDNSVNAFATEFGLIGVNYGLINLTASESELAAVIAHEIAHIKLKHFARFAEKSKYNGLLTIGSIILASMSKNSKMTEALIGGSVALNAQLFVNFTRENEIEADDYGKQLLQKSIFNNNAMSVFFNKLSKLNIESNEIEFLRTHPLSKNRAINSYDVTLTNSKKHTNSFKYLVLKKIINPNFKTKEIVEKYLQAYNLFNNNNLQAALKILQKFNNKTINILKARIYSKLGQLNKALKFLQGDEYLDKFYQALVLFENQKYNQALTIIKQQNYVKPNIYNYDLIAKIELKKYNEDKYYYNLGLKFQVMHKLDLAKQQFNLAKNITQNQDLLDILNFKIKNIDKLQKQNND